MHNNPIETRVANPYQTTAAVDSVGSTQSVPTPQTNRTIEFLWLGPALGAAIGFTQMIARISVYLIFGKPDGFYFRGLQSAIRELLPINTVGGLIFGVPFGIAVLLTLIVLRRVSQPSPAFFIAVAVTSLVSLAIAFYEFQAERMLTSAHTIMAIIVAFIVVLASSKPIST